MEQKKGFSQSRLVLSVLLLNLIERDALHGWKAINVMLYGHGRCCGSDELRGKTEK